MTKTHVTGARYCSFHLQLAKLSMDTLTIHLPWLLHIQVRTRSLIYDSSSLHIWLVRYFFAGGHLQKLAINPNRPTRLYSWVLKHVSQKNTYHIYLVGYGYPNMKHNIFKTHLVPVVCHDMSTPMILFFAPLRCGNPCGPGTVSAL